MNDTDQDTCTHNWEMNDADGVWVCQACGMRIDQVANPSMRWEK